MIRSTCLLIDWSVGLSLSIECSVDLRSVFYVVLFDLSVFFEWSLCRLDFRLVKIYILIGFLAGRITFKMVRSTMSVGHSNEYSERMFVEWPVGPIRFLDIIGLSCRSICGRSGPLTLMIRWNGRSDLVGRSTLVYRLVFPLDHCNFGRYGRVDRSILP